VGSGYYRNPQRQFVPVCLSHQVFPQPLSEEDERKCLQEMQRGGEEARNILIEHNLRLVAHVVKKSYDL